MLKVAEEFHGSHTGRQRRANEDSLYVRTPLFAVADGMGGARAGEIASRIAVETLGAAGAPAADQAGAEGRLAEIVQAANERIYEEARSDESRAGMGTTMTVALVGEDDVTIAHVGDSRAYRLRGDDFQVLTDDHSLVAELRRQGRLTEEEAEGHPQSSIITRALGPEPHVEVDTHTWPARDGDVFLICSDGLTTMVKEGAIAEAVHGAPSLRDAGERLIEAANEAGGRDNITVILFRLEDIGAGADQATSVGDDALRTDDVRAAVEAEERRGPVATMSPARERERAPSRRLDPIRPSGSQEGRPKRERPRWLRRTLVTLAIVAFIVVPVGIGVLTALRAVYFIGSDDQGYVTIFRGVPWELPLGVDLYQTNYTSAVNRASVPTRRRETLLDHSLRSRDDAYEIVSELERGRLESR